MRIGEQRADRLLLDLLPGIEHRDPLGGLRDHAHVVGDEHQRHSRLALQREQQIENLRLDGDVERRRRLVGDDQLRIAGDRHGDHHALVHAAGQLMRKRAQPPLRDR